MTDVDVQAATIALGRQLAQARRHAGLTQHTLAGRVSYSRTTLANVEIGRQRAVREFWVVVDQVLGAGGVLVTQADHLDALIEQRRADRDQAARQRRYEHARTIPAPAGPTPVTETEEVDRRDLLRALAMTGAALAAPALDVPGPGRVDETDVAQYASLTAHLWQVYALTPAKRRALPLVRDQLDALTEHLGRPQRQAVRQRLCAVAADSFQLAGEIYLDADRDADAAQCYSLAASASREAGDFDLWACALTRHAFLSLYDRRPDQAAPMLDAAAQVALRGDQELATRHWVQAVRAQALAGLGDLDGCQAALEGAAQVTGTTAPGGWLRFDDTRLPEERGACFTALGRPDLAEAALAEALTADISPRRRGSVLVDLAVAGVQRGDVEQVLTYADEVIDLAEATGSGVIARRLRDLRAHLAPLLADGRVRRLDARIAATV